MHWRNPSERYGIVARALRWPTVVPAAVNQVARLLTVSLLAASPALSICWEMQPGAEAIVFTGTQAGTPVSGEFKRFQGQLYLAPDAPGRNFLHVNVDTASLDARFPELEEVLRGADFFDVGRWPQAVFRSASITALDKRRYRAEGSLRIRDIRRPVAVTFQFEPQSDDVVLMGRETLQRLDFDIGTGEWRDTQWVANEVVVRVNIPLTRIPETQCERG